ncbi:unnamed protein product [Caenorhabditis sp. 36 PRJEB53466]|nr:unnamed protein product [Caenorhabditis sp. 36 PRJEB53466]
MEAQIRSVREQIENVQLLLIAVERQSGKNEMERLIKNANNSLLKTETNMYRLESQLNREPATVRQTVFFKVEQLKSDIYLIKNSLMGMENKHDNQRKRAQEKEELLKKRFTTNNETRVNLGFDEELNTNERLKFSDNILDQMLAQGASVFEDLQKQKSNLLSIRKRFHFLTKSLGISYTTIHLIEKRVREDKKLFFILALCCLIFMFFFYYWWQH